MRRFLASALLALILGLLLGVYVGWTQLPLRQTTTPLCQLAEEEREQYTLMVARGYRAHRDRDVALNDLLPLRSAEAETCLRDQSVPNIDNIPAWVQEITERYRTRGEKLEQVCDLARLSASFGRQIPGYADGSPSAVCPP
jgi:hypothetical protein